jgi:PhnB protein
MALPDNPSSVTIVPQLSVRRGRAAVEFYKRAFGAIEVYRVGGTDDNPEVVAQLAVGTASFWVSDESPPHANFSPESVGGGTVRMLLIVDDPDAGIERAKAAGAKEVYPAREEHGWRLGRVADPFGHHWEIGRPLISWPPARGRPDGDHEGQPPDGMPPRPLA